MVFGWFSKKTQKEEQPPAHTVIQTEAADAHTQPLNEIVFTEYGKDGQVIERYSTSLTDALTTITAALDAMIEGDRETGRRLLEKGADQMLASPQPDGPRFGRCVQNLIPQLVMIDDRKAIALLSRAATALSTPENASAKVEVLRLLAEYHLEAGNDDGGIDATRLAASTLSASADATTKDKLQGWVDLAKALTNAGRTNEAVPLLRDIQPALTQEYGEISEEHGDLLDTLAMALAKNEHPDEAMTAAQQAIDVFEQLEGENSLRSARMLGLVLPPIYRALGQEELREVVQRRAEKIFDARSGELGYADQRDYANLLSNIGSTLATRAEYAGAIRYMRRSLELKQAEGENPQLLMILTKLAATSAESGAFDEADKYAERMVRIARSYLGDDHPRTQDCLGLANKIKNDPNRQA